MLENLGSIGSGPLRTLNPNNQAAPGPQAPDQAQSQAILGGALAADASMVSGAGRLFRGATTGKLPWLDGDGNLPAPGGAGFGLGADSPATNDSGAAPDMRNAFSGGNLTDTGLNSFQETAPVALPQPPRQSRSRL